MWFTFAACIVFQLGSTSVEKELWMYILSNGLKNNEIHRKPIQFFKAFYWNEVQFKMTGDPQAPNFLQSQ